MKEETLSLKGKLMETLPIAPLTKTIRIQVEPTVKQLIALTKKQRETKEQLLDWLRVEFDIKRPGQRLEEFFTLDQDALVKEINHRRPRSADRLSPSDVKILRTAYDDYASPIRALETKAQQLERQLAALINTAYGLTPDEEELLWRTAPLRTSVRWRSKTQWGGRRE